MTAPDEQPPRSAAPPGRHPTWRALRGLFLFRILVVCGLLLAFSPEFTQGTSVRIDTALAWPVLGFHALAVLLSGLGLRTRRPRREHQVQLAIFIDLLAFTLLMHAAGGVSSGFGVLLALAVAVGALLMEGRLSLLFAALATLAVITQQVYSQLQGGAPVPDSTHAGLLGSLFFTVALLSNALYRRVRTAETLAARRLVDIANLSKLNDFIVRHIGTGILAVDGERRLRLINQAALDLLATPPPPPGTPLARIHSELCEWLSEHVQPGIVREGELRAGGRTLQLSVKPLGMYRAAGAVLYLRDREEVIREARQVRLAALGTLTASIAHNIRNPLSAVTHAGQLLAESQSLSADDRHLLDIIQRNCARIEDTVSSVLQLSRRRDRQPARLDPHDWLTAFADEFRDSQGLDPARLVLDGMDAAPPLEADPRHLRQILVNLCENALVHAGSPDRPAHLILRLARHESGGRLDILDDGPGIDPDLIPRLFDPFFTTRASGNGLGLYIARELAEANDLRMVYWPRDPHGSCFSLIWPAS